MGYDPFARGPSPVGVQSGLGVDTARGDRQLPFEVWYPAVRDSTMRAERHPLVLYSHASYGHRRQSSFLSTHLASHGYVVAAADHTGNTAVDFAERTQRLAAGSVRTQEEVDAYVRRIIADRVPDLRFLLDQVLAFAPGVSQNIDERRVGLIGWSFGGWAALSTLEADDRFGALVALAPAGNSKPLPGIIPATLTFAWKRDVPTLFLVAERDRFTPLAGQHELLERTPSRKKKMFVLRNADHQHFADQVDDPGLCSPEAAHAFTRGLSLAHLDSVLREDEAASRFMESDPVSSLRERGVDAFAALVTNR